MALLLEDLSELDDDLTLLLEDLSELDDDFTLLLEDLSELDDDLALLLDDFSELDDNLELLLDDFSELDDNLALLLEDFSELEDVSVLILDDDTAPISDEEFPSGKIGLLSDDLSSPQATKKRKTAPKQPMINLLHMLRPLSRCIGNSQDYVRNLISRYSGNSKAPS